MAKPTKNQYCRVIIISLAAFITISGFIYSFVEKNRASSEYQKLENKHSKCIMVTEPIYKLPINWNKLLLEDVVLLVLSHSLYENLKYLDKKNSYKVIHCNCQDSLWSCVKHLRKQDLILSQEFLSQHIPNDITLYVENIIKI